MLGKSLKAVGLFVLCGLILPNFFSANSSSVDQKPQWQYYKDIGIIGSLEKGDLIKVILDQEIFDVSKKDLGDLRVVDQEGADVPYKLIVEQDVFKEENIYPVHILNNSYNAKDGYNSFIVDFGQGGSLNSSLNIITGSTNFKRTVEISGSDDTGPWNVLKSNGYIYDYTDRVGNFKAQNASVDYSENAFRYIQVKIFTGGEVPLSISGAQVSKITKKEKKEASLNPAYEVRENSDKRTTEIVVDLERNGWPTSSMTLTSPDENFNREIAIYESGDKTVWQSVGQGYIFNYNTPKFVGENLSIHYRETSKRYLKIEIYNGDDRPIAITGVSAKTILRSIVFQNETVSGGNAYRLYYGNPSANFPEYDLEKFFSYLDTGKYHSSSLSAQHDNSSYQKKTPPALPLSERIPYLVPGALVLAIVMMSLILFRFIKKASLKK